MKFICSALLILGMAPCLFGADTPVHYQISVSLDPVSHLLDGNESIEWRNTTSTPTSELYFHLYLNAFANNRSTFMKELGEGTLRSRLKVERHWGWTRILSMKTSDGVDLSPSLSFVRPDDDNVDDFTVARVELPKPVEPGASIKIALEFEAKLPLVIARTGWAAHFHLVGQWFPKLGVYEAAGHGGRLTAGWNCHQFHASSEFYADFASYRVEIEVPQDYVVAATGIEVEHHQEAEGTSRSLYSVYTAENVHDFAWCAAPQEMMMVVEGEFEPARDIPQVWLEEATKDLKMSAAELELPPVHLRLLIPRQQEKLAERTLHAARLGIAWYGLHYGPYPYPQLSIISPPPTAREAGGMEYPTFITTGAAKLMEYFPFSGASLIEMVTIHEFGHQYFYGMLASNEFEQAWMDEGINSYAETSCRAAIARDKLVKEQFNFSPWASARLQLSALKNPLKVDRFAWNFRSQGNYSMASYTKTELLLRTLEGLVGKAPFARAMRQYALQWRFKHPTGRDFMQSISTSTSQELDWFFSQAIEGDAIVDWAISSVHTEKERDFEGATYQDGAWTEEDQPKDSEPDTGNEDSGPFMNRFDVLRKGSFSGPVDILLIFADGTEEHRHWDGLARWKHFDVESDTKLTAIVVDPEGVWALETRRQDNYWHRASTTPADPTSSWSWSFSNILSLFPVIWS